VNRTIKEAIVKVFDDETLESRSAHVLAFVTAYNFTNHLKVICGAWTKDPAPFKINPHHLIPGPYTQPSLPEGRRTQPFLSAPSA
jgi:hypothetical protein